MSIWIGDPTVEIANEKGVDTLNRNLGIELTEMTEDSMKGRMPVDERTKQPAGVLHGGASVAFAETLASWASIFAVDRTRFHCVGMEINANHVRPVSSGWVYGEATPLALGRRTHVWEIRIVNDEGKLVCVSRCTMAVLEMPSQY
ncbi:hotdog fold thioesterase [Prescottella agglutinans]|uniref:Hotdog fold thioesterase n=1 Tax=Prescottella agglutinans TaxID=1644129 RepID=A0A438BKX2_9NOCA|nr:hotdog fold thioesterase [Prescottella agglutinans]RVW11520.1 hotdog fold thioesterase [Prescottella agglutinans]